jgi:glucokinase
MARYGGIDLGGTKIQAVVTDHEHEVLGSSRLPTPITGGPADVALAMIAAVHEAAEQAGVGPGELTAVGVGSPGVVDDEAGTVTSARNLPDWEGTYPLAEKLGAALIAPVGLSNDVNVATNAEFELGAAKPFRSILGVFWGTGVGGGVVLDGKLWEGRGGAGEIGHMVVKSDGRRCPCGRIGCMEAYAGRGAMEVRAREKVAAGEKTVLFEIMEEREKSRLASGIWERALARDDKLAHQLVDRAVEAIGVAVASAVNLLDVEAVVIGGGLGLRLGQPYVERIREAMMPHVFADHRPPEVLLASLGDLGGAIGATLLAAERAPSPARAHS